MLQEDTLQDRHSISPASSLKKSQTGERIVSRTIDEQTGIFTVKDQEGQERTILIITSFNEVWTGEKFEKFPKRQCFRTTGGRPVSRVEKGRYEIFDEPGTILISDDPNAP